MQKIAIRVCECDGTHENFPISEYRFDELGTIQLPDLCPQSDLDLNQLTNFELLLQTVECNINWTFYTLYVGQISRIQKNLYLYSFRDIDEVGESNFYLEGSSDEVVDYLLTEWGELAPDWRGLFKDWGANGVPKGYDSSKLTTWTGLFTNPNPESVTDLEGLEVSLFLNLEDDELVSTLKKL